MSKVLSILAIEGPCTLLVPEIAMDFCNNIFQSIQFSGETLILSAAVNRELFGHRYECLTMERSSLVSGYISLQ